METFRHFITEMHDFGDHRSDKTGTKPFYVSTHPYSNELKHGFSVHDQDALSAQWEKPANDKFRGALSAGFTVHPSEKKIDFDIQKQQGYNNRRPWKKVTPPETNYFRAPPEPSRAAVIPEPGSKIPHHELRRVIGQLASTHGLHDYTMHGDGRWEGKKVHEFLSEKTPHEKLMSGEPLTFYHGTSSKKAGAVLKTGLSPSKRGHLYAGQVKDYSEHHVYLSTHPDEAANYATREAINDGGRAAILKVTVHPKDFHHFRPDEDTLHWSTGSLDKHVLKHLTNKHPAIADNPDVHFKNLADAEYVSGKKSSIGDPRWGNHMDKSKIPAGEDEEAYRQRIGKDFVKAYVGKNINLNRHSSVAFRGSISPEHISIHKSFGLEKVKMHGDNEEYNQALDRVKASTRHGEI